MTIPMFRTPEEVAPELGMTKTELRRYCRESGHCTRLSKNRIMLHADDVANIIAWVQAKQATKDKQWTVGAPGRDPFD